MINFFNDILSNNELFASNLGYKYLNIAGKMVYIMGYKEILVFTSETMSFKLAGKKVLSIRGADLSLKEMDGEIAMICGLISVVEVIG